MLPFLSLAFLAGLAMGSVVSFFPLTIAAGLLFLLGFLTWVERRQILPAPQTTVTYAGLLAGVLYWIAIVPPPGAIREDGAWLESRSDARVGRVVEPVRHGPERATLLVALEGQSARDGSSTLVRLTWRDPSSGIFQGDRVAFHAKLHVPSGSLNPGGFDYAAYVERQGIDAVGTVVGSEAVEVRESGLERARWAGWGRLDRWRGAIREAALFSLQQPASGIFLGMVIGERGYLSEEVQEWFMATGTVHLLSISGSHLGVIAIGLFWGWRRLVLLLPATLLLHLTRWITPTRLAVVFTWCGVSGYALLAGAELATVRAWIMISLGLLAVWMGSDRSLGHALAAAALLIVLHDPRAIADISFQLSFLSVLAIVWIVDRWRLESDRLNESPLPWSQRLLRGVRDAGVLSGVVTVVTLPVVAWYFNQIPWIGLAANLVAVPLVGGLLVPVGLLAAGWTLISGSTSLCVSTVQQLLIDGVAGGLHWVASWPATTWHVAAPSGLVIVLWYAGVWLASRAGTRMRDWCLIGFISIGAVGLWAWESRAWQDGDAWRVTFLDVGQGDSAVVELPDGKTVLVDAGGRYERFDAGRSIVGPFMWNHGIRQLDAVVATHPQVDHVGGLPWLVRHEPVASYWDAGVERQEPFFEGLRQALGERRIIPHHAQRGQEIVSGGGCLMRVVSPFESSGSDVVGRSSSGSHLNNHSIATELECGSQVVLFTADLEIEGLRRLLAAGQRAVAVLKVPHHGGRSSLDPDWVRAVHPRYAVISVGRHNSYGHPAPAVLEAYGAEGSEINRTDRDGAVIVTGRVSTAEVQVERMRDLLLSPVFGESEVGRREQDNWCKLWRRWTRG